MHNKISIKNPAKQNLLRLAAMGLIGSALVTAPCQGAIYLSLMGNASRNNESSQVSYKKMDSKTFSVGAAVDVGTNLRLGVTHKQLFSSVDGMEKKRLTNDYYNAPGNAHVTANSLDLTIILYSGELLTPYLLAGFVFKKYEFESTKEDEAGGIYVEQTTAPFQGPFPSGGGGLGLKVNRSVSLKFQYTITPVPVQNPNETTSHFANDTDGQIGLSYQFD